MKKYFVIAISVLLINGAFAQNLYMLPENFKSSTLSSFENLNGVKGEGGKTNKTAKGNAFEGLKSGESKTLLEIEGPGIIQRMWFTVRDRSPEIMRSTRLQIYWDGESKAAVDVPFGDFFGYGLSKVVEFESALFSNPEGRSFNCMIPMPFRKAARVDRNGLIIYIVYNNRMLFHYLFCCIIIFYSITVIPAGFIFGNICCRYKN